jgi:hypothetical protein
MDYAKYIVSTCILLSVSIIYDRFKLYAQQDEDMKNYYAVKQYLVTDSTLAKSKLPILWIYIDYQQNSRWWQNFYSRNSSDLNQPYLYLTIKSIIDRCSSHFNVCIIDDLTLTNIIPGWNIDLAKTSSPIREKLRDLAQAKILKYYGGIFVPPSFLCLKNLIRMYYASTVGGKMFVGELPNENITSTNDSVFVSRKFIGAHKNSKVVDEYIHYLQHLISSDYTAESVFEGNADRWLYDQTKQNKISIIPAKQLGARDAANKDVLIEELIGNSFIDFDPSALGIYFPQSQLMNRVSFQWFSRLSARQALESDTIMGKLLLSNCVS